MKVTAVILKPGLFKGSRDFRRGGGVLGGEGLAMFNRQSAKIKLTPIYLNVLQQLCNSPPTKKNPLNLQKFDLLKIFDFDSF